MTTYFTISLFQKRVREWILTTLGKKSGDNLEERLLRFYEEATELVQALDLPKERAQAILDYVYGRPKGDPEQEFGGTGITLAGLASCRVVNISLQQAFNKELRRCHKNSERIAAKQMAKELRGEGL